MEPMICISLALRISEVLLSCLVFCLYLYSLFCWQKYTIGKWLSLVLSYTQLYPLWLLVLVWCRMRIFLFLFGFSLFTLLSNFSRITEVYIETWLLLHAEFWFWQKFHGQQRGFQLC